MHAYGVTRFEGKRRGWEIGKRNIRRATPLTRSKKQNKGEKQIGGENEGKGEKG